MTFKAKNLDLLKFYKLKEEYISVFIKGTPK